MASPRAAWTGPSSRLAALLRPLPGGLLLLLCSLPGASAAAPPPGGGGGGGAAWAARGASGAAGARQAAWAVHPDGRLERASLRPRGRSGERPRRKAGRATAAAAGGGGAHAAGPGALLQGGPVYDEARCAGFEAPGTGAPAEEEEKAAAALAALRVAVERGDVAEVKSLLDARADPRALDRDNDLGLNAMINTDRSGGGGAAAAEVHALLLAAALANDLCGCAPGAAEQDGCPESLDGRLAAAQVTPEHVTLAIGRCLPSVVPRLLEQASKASSPHQRDTRADHGGAHLARHPALQAGHLKLAVEKCPLAALRLREYATAEDCNDIWDPAIERCDGLLPVVEHCLDLVPLPGLDRLERAVEMCPAVAWRLMKGLTPEACKAQLEPAIARCNDNTMVIEHCADLVQSTVLDHVGLAYEKCPAVAPRFLKSFSQEPCKENLFAAIQRCQHMDEVVKHCLELAQPDWYHVEIAITACPSAVDLVLGKFLEGLSEEGCRVPEDEPPEEGLLADALKLCGGAEDGSIRAQAIVRLVGHCLRLVPPELLHVETASGSCRPALGPILQAALSTTTQKQNPVDAAAATGGQSCQRDVAERCLQEVQPKMTHLKLAAENCPDVMDSLTSEGCEAILEPAIAECKGMTPIIKHCLRLVPPLPRHVDVAAEKCPEAVELFLEPAVIRCQNMEEVIRRCVNVGPKALQPRPEHLKLAMEKCHSVIQYFVKALTPEVCEANLEAALKQCETMEGVVTGCLDLSVHRRWDHVELAVRHCAPGLVGRLLQAAPAEECERFFEHAITACEGAQGFISSCVQVVTPQQKHVELALESCHAAIGVLVQNMDTREFGGILDLAIKHCSGGKDAIEQVLPFVRPGLDSVRRALADCGETLRGEPKELLLALNAGRPLDDYFIDAPVAKLLWQKLDVQQHLPDVRKFLQDQGA